MISIACGSDVLELDNEVPSSMELCAVTIEKKKYS